MPIILALQHLKKKKKFNEGGGVQKEVLIATYGASKSENRI